MYLTDSSFNSAWLIFGLCFALLLNMFWSAKEAWNLVALTREEFPF